MKYSKDLGLLTQMMTERIYQINKNKIKSILLGIGAFVMVSMSLFHAPFKRFSDEYLLHYNTHSEIIKERDFKQDSLLHELGKTLTIEEYKIARNLHWKLSKQQLQTYAQKKEQLFKEHSFLGRGSFKFWLFLFGIVVLGFYFSIKSLLDDYQKPFRTGHEIISMIGISVSVFWFYHLFFQTATDFYTEVYLVFKFLICIAITFFISLLIKYFTKKEHDIKSLLKLVFRIKRKHYRKMTVNALYAERYDKSVDAIETIKNQADDFDKDVTETINRIIT